MVANPDKYSCQLCLNDVWMVLTVCSVYKLYKTNKGSQKAAKDEKKKKKKKIVLSLQKYNGSE